MGDLREGNDVTLENDIRCGMSDDEELLTSSRTIDLIVP